jgi:hypothetical protein
MCACTYPYAHMRESTCTKSDKFSPIQGLKSHKLIPVCEAYFLAYWIPLKQAANMRLYWASTQSIHHLSSVLETVRTAISQVLVSQLNARCSPSSSQKIACVFGYMVRIYICVSACLCDMTRTFMLEEVCMQQDICLYISCPCVCECTNISCVCVESIHTY